jgi:hypothetical protein
MSLMNSILAGAKLIPGCESENPRANRDTHFGVGFPKPLVCLEKERIVNYLVWIRIQGVMPLDKLLQ